MLTENRKQTGLMEGQSVTFNMSAASIDAVCGALFVDERRESRRATAIWRALSMCARSTSPRPSKPSAAATSRRCCSPDGWRPIPGCLILDEPTLGVDVGARFELYRLIRRLADEGRAVLMISSDLNEVIDECDRILTMYKGRITGEFEHGASRLEIMAAATGESQSDERH